MFFNFSVPGHNADIPFTVESGTSLFFVGANGAGKTRLAVRIENSLGRNAHRISAHRAQALNPGVAKISEQAALRGLRFGQTGEQVSEQYRASARWQNSAATSLLTDYDFVLQALFAEQTNRSLETHRRARRGPVGEVIETNLEKLEAIWSRLLPHRQLDISGDDIRVIVPGSEVKYGAAELSDGERAIFYLIGQTLSAANESLLIFDEPELHVHRSIMARLWDELESARPDCAFVYITHDLEFAASRIGQKWVVRDYDPAPHWTIERVPEESGFDEEITTLILGSRKAILFVEGGGSSLDVTGLFSSYVKLGIASTTSRSRAARQRALRMLSHPFALIRL